MWYLRLYCIQKGKKNMRGNNKINQVWLKTVTRDNGRFFFKCDEINSFSLVSRTLFLYLVFVVRVSIHTVYVVCSTSVNM